MRFSYKYIIISFGISIMIALLVYCYFPFYNVLGAEKALEGLLLLSSISLGFYGASLTILASIINTNVLREIIDDKEEKRELLIVLFITLVSGFLTVIVTIVYQVLLSHENNYISLINSVWFFTVSLFLSMKILFVLIIFMVLFNNRDDENKKRLKTDDVYNPTINDN